MLFHHSSKEQLILLLRKSTNLSQGAIADRLGIPDSEVSRTLRRHHLGARQRPPLLLARARELWESGRSNLQISAEIGVPPGTLDTWKHRYGFMRWNDPA